MFSLPPVTRNLIVACTVVYFLQSSTRLPIDEYFALWPPGELFRPWQLVTYAFLHGGFTHLLFNMFGLWMFGAELERYWGAGRFSSYLLASTLGASALQLGVVALTEAPYATVGASGGLFGLLLAFAMTFPNRTIVPLIPPIPMPAWLFVTLYGLLELYLGVTGTAEGVAHFAHLGGMAGGWLMMRYWGRRRRR